jgi:hypothetical protein
MEGKAREGKAREGEGVSEERAVEGTVRRSQ